MVEKTPDGRHVVVDGRKWRASDPELDQELRRALVSELMAARRHVKEALSDNDPRALKMARARVHDAKVALGERGKPWWEPQTPSDEEERLAATERALSVRNDGPSSAETD